MVRFLNLYKGWEKGFFNGRKCLFGYLFLTLSADCQNMRRKSKQPQLSIILVFTWTVSVSETKERERDDCCANQITKKCQLHENIKRFQNWEINSNAENFSI